MDFIPAYDPQMVLDHMEINLRRDLPEVKVCRPHAHKMSVAGGAPSLSDTKDKLDGYICAINGSLNYLYDNGIEAQACGILDPHVDVKPIKGVHYYVCSIARPEVFDALKNEHVVMWHSSGPTGAEEVLKKHRKDYLMMGGGSTMGLRWINLGYMMGFREFHLHGLDSSYRNGSTHAYNDHEREQRMTVNGRETSPNFLKQVSDFSGVMDRFSQPDVDPVNIKLYGTGLMQDTHAQYCMR